MTTLKDYAIRSLDQDSGQPTTSLHELIGSKKFVIDFWTTKCVRCPAALDKLNIQAEEAIQKGENVVFVSCALDNPEIAADIVEESESWDHLVHVCMDADTKEQLKKDFGFSQVPFCIIGDSNKLVHGADNPKSLDVPGLLQQAGAGAGGGGALSSSLFTDDDF